MVKIAKRNAKGKPPMKVVRSVINAEDKPPAEVIQCIARAIHEGSNVHISGTTISPLLTIAHTELTRLQRIKAQHERAVRADANINRRVVATLKEINSYALRELQGLPVNVATARIEKSSVAKQMPEPEPARIDLLEKNIEFLLKNNVGVDHKIGGTPLLHKAIEEENHEWFLKLLRGGADPMALDNEGRTALHVASLFAQDEMVQELLLRPCVNKTVKDFNSQTAAEMIGDGVNRGNYAQEIGRIWAQLGVKQYGNPVPESSLASSGASNFSGSLSSPSGSFQENHASRSKSPNIFSRA